MAKRTYTRKASEARGFRVRRAAEYVASTFGGLVMLHDFDERAAFVILHPTKGFLAPSPSITFGAEA